MSRAARLQDIRIALASCAQLRALTTTGRQYQPGEEVFVELPLERRYVVNS